MKRRGRGSGGRARTSAGWAHGARNAHPGDSECHLKEAQKREKETVARTRSGSGMPQTWCGGVPTTVCVPVASSRVVIKSALQFAWVPSPAPPPGKPRSVRRVCGITEWEAREGAQSYPGPSPALSEAIAPSAQARCKGSRMGAAEARKRPPPMSPRPNTLERDGSTHVDRGRHSVAPGYKRIEVAEKTKETATNGMKLQVPDRSGAKACSKRTCGATLVQMIEPPPCTQINEPEACRIDVRSHVRSGVRPGGEGVGQHYTCEARV
eukprot:9500924-Pyramimonas_sp.AAC.5